MFKKALMIIGIAFVFLLTGCKAEREVLLIDPFFEEEQVLISKENRTEITIDFKKGYTLEGLYHDEELTDLYLEIDRLGFINVALEELFSKKLISRPREERLYVGLHEYEGVVESPRGEQTTYYLKWEPKEYTVYELAESNESFTGITRYERMIYAYNAQAIYVHEVFKDFHVEEERSYFSLVDVELGLADTEEIVHLYPKEDGFYIYTSEHDVLHVSFDEEETLVERLDVPFAEEELVKIEANHRIVLFLTTNGELYALGDEDYIGLFGFSHGLSDQQIELMELEGNPRIEDVYLGTSYFVVEDNMGRLFLNGKSSFVGEESEDSLNISYMQELDTSMLDEDIEEVLLGGSGYGIMVRTSSGELYAMGYNLDEYITDEEIEYVRSFQNVTSKVYGNLSNYYLDWVRLFYQEGDTLYDIEGNTLYQIDESFGKLEELIIDSDYILALYENNYVDIVRVRSAQRMNEENLPAYEDDLYSLQVHYYQINGLDYLIEEEHVYFYQVEATLGENLYKDPAYTVEASKTYVVTEDAFFYKKEE